MASGGGTAPARTGPAGTGPAGTGPAGTGLVGPAGAEGPLAVVGPGRVARSFVRSFLVLFVFCGLTGTVLWPLSGWHLFSHVRTDRAHGWEVVAVDRAGAERPVPFGDLGAGLRGAPHVAAGLAGLPLAERRATCEAWAEAATSAGLEAAEVRVYAVEGPVAGSGPWSRELRFTCPVRVR
ncbi:MAG: hypothetical protein AB1673_09765 [Actinomycetota bacterium]